MEKAELRRQLLQKRQAMSVQEWREKSDRITTHLAKSPLFTQAKTVLAYFSFRQEPDLSSLFKDIPGNTKWGFPRCVGDALSWHIWTPLDAVKIGAYGIREPLAEAAIIQPAEVDLIFVPCVACDYQGFRLGYGGGYYDRLLSSVEWAKKMTIGIVFAEAYLPQLPVSAWDKKLQAVCTEAGFKMIY